MMEQAMKRRETEAGAGMARRETILAELRELMQQAMPAMAGDGYVHVPFLEMGANSLILMEMQQTVERRYGVTLEIGQFFEELTTIDALASYLDEQVPADAAPAADLSSVDLSLLPLSPIAGSTPEGLSTDLEQLFSEQLQSVAQTVSRVVAQQLEYLRQTGLAPPAGTDQPGQAGTAPADATTPSASGQASAGAATTGAAAQKPGSAASPQHMLSPLEIRARGLTPRQQEHLEALIARYTERTRTSREMVARDRPVLADSRACVGFRFSTKEMLYPVVGKRARGARVWDVDDNEYVDITMGQGVTLFGHHPPFLEAALAAEPEDCVQLGPRPPQAGEAARLITEFTGFDRVTFTNSGTEAVMAALRLARAATGRQKIVMFENAYHGHSDGTTARAQWHGEQLSSVPISGGIPPSAVEAIYVLEYDAPASLDFIEAHGEELAAVIAEPVQSRRPDLQPKAFLQRLRELTSASGALLILDEMITGFRVHPGGAQAWFGVRADMATYGKVLGGGMPIGVVAGRAEHMNAIDGGMWQYGDASYPRTERVGFGGTFCQHPLTMVTALATLRHLKEQGPGLQQGLNEKTERLARTLNAYFHERRVPIEVVYFGSLFRFAFSTNLELLFYHLMEQGVFIWEWRNYFLSTAHTEADVDFVIEAVKASTEKLIEGGFIEPATEAAAGASGSSIPGNGHPAGAASPASTGSPLASLPLTEAQRQLWALDRITPQGSAAYTVFVVLELTGRLEIGSMRAAVERIVARHDALRTVLPSASEQRVLADVETDVPLVDLSGTPETETRVREWLEEAASEPLDLAAGPLFRAWILRSSAERHRLVLRGHHSIIDGLSMNVVIRETAATYSALVRQQEPQLDACVQFGQFVQLPPDPDRAKHEAFWLQQLDGELPTLELPADRPHPSLRTYAGGRTVFPLDTGVRQAAARLSQQQRCTPFMTWFAVYALWLHRLSGQDDLVVGIPVAGRPATAGFDSMVGYCTHLLPVRSRLGQDETFAEFLTATRTRLLEAYTHQGYPYSELLNELDLPRGGARAPLVSTVFNLDRPGDAPEMAGLGVAWASAPLRHTAFDLTVNLTEVGEDVVLECDFNRDIFETTTMERLCEAFRVLLAAVVENPQERAAALPLLDVPERQRLLVEWNATEAAYPSDQCAHQLFEAQARRTPDAVAAVAGDAQLSYDGLNTQAQQLARVLRGHGVGRDTVVGICTDRSLEMIVAMMGVLKAGGAFLPLDPNYPPARLGFMLEDAAAPVLLTTRALMQRVPLRDHVELPDERVIYLDGTAAWTDLPGADLGEAPRPDDLAYVIYTSGSTGKPKGTMIEHRGLVNYLSWAVRTYRMDAGCGAPVLTSIGFDATITSIFAPLISGQGIWLVPASPDAGEEIQAIHDAVAADRRWSLIKVTPAHLELLNSMLADDAFADQTNVIVLGGEALYGSTVAPWRERAPGTRLINEYGPTETVVGCCVHEVGEDTPHDGAVAIGRPIANTWLYVLDAGLQPVPVGVPGELFIGGHGVARGYLNRPELTAERFVANPFGPGRLYRSGDEVRHLANGELEYLGRLDTQVKIRGYRVEPGEIASLLNLHSSVRESVVVPREFGANDLRLLAYVVPLDGDEVDAEALRGHLSVRLPAHMVPVAFIPLQALPLTTNGKIDRKALPDSEGALTRTQAGFASPQSEAEKRIAQAWQEALKVDCVGRLDNFFDLGGHSLLVVSLRDRLAAEFEHELTPVDLFRYPTVASLARYLTAAPEATEALPDEVRQQATRQRQALQQQRKLRGRRGGRNG